MIKFIFLCLVLPQIASANVNILFTKNLFDSKNGVYLRNKYIVYDTKIITILSENDFLKSKYKKNTPVLKTVEYLFPGLIDCHTHIFFKQFEKDLKYENALIRELSVSSNDRMKLAKKYLKQYLENGFTSVCDLGNSGDYLDVKLKKEINRNDLFPHMFISGKGIAVGKAQFDSSAELKSVEKEYDIIKSSQDISKLIRNHLDNNVDILKIYLDNSPGGSSLNTNQVFQLLNTSKGKFKKVTFHSIDGKYLNDQISKKIDSYEHFNFVPANLISTPSKIFITATEIESETLKKFKYYSAAQDLVSRGRAKWLKENHFNIVFGSDFYFENEELNYDRGKESIKSLMSLSRKLKDNILALRSATYLAAKSLSEENKYGVIQKNSYANFVGFKNNPLVEVKELENNVLVINLGKVIKN